MGRPRSAKGRFAKCNSVEMAAKARAVKRKSYESELDESSVAGVSLSESPAVDETTGTEQFPCRGRRTVHLSSFAEALSSCKNPACGEPLVLKDCQSEQRYGLASVLRVPCRHCDFVSRVDTDTRMESDQQRGPRPFSSNKKIALGKNFVDFCVQILSEDLLYFFLFKSCISWLRPKRISEEIVQ